MGLEGGSADRRARELAAQGDGAGLAWAAGAEGERRVAAQLATLRDVWTVLHDRLLRPGLSAANLDHVVVGPGGLFLVDAKNWSGNVTAFEGGLYQHLGPVSTRTSHSRHAEIAKVHGMAAYMAVEAGMPVTPVICLAGSNEQSFGEPQMLRGVWVVPASKLVAWLESRDYVLDRDARARSVTHVMASFPSTTTDPELLAAKGASSPAAARRPRVKKGRPPQSERTRGRGRGSQSTPKRSQSMASRLARSLLGLGFALVTFWALLAYLPPVLTALVEAMVTPASSGRTSGLQGPTEIASPESTPAARAKATTTKSATTAVPKPPRPVVCSSASRTQVSKIVGRPVQPVAVRTGCAWGTRLDDPATTVVTISVSTEHTAYDYELEASRTQRRVVYGSRLDAAYRPGTALWVATGQPIKHSKSTSLARADTQVMVSREALGVSDDRARAMALAIAAAVNRG